MNNSSGKGINLYWMAISYCALFFVCTFISAVLSYNSGILGGDFVSFNFSVTHEMVLNSTLRSIVFDCCFLLLFYFSFRIFGYGGIRAIVNSESGKLDFIFAIMLIFLVIAMMLTTVGSAVREGVTNRFVDLLFAFFQPFYLTIIYLYSKGGENGRIKSLVLVLFIFACLLSGFTGYLLYIFPLVFPFVKRKLGIRMGWVLVGLGICFLPVLRFSKFLFLRGVDAINFEQFGIKEALDYYSIFLEIVIDRFSYVHNIIYIDNNIEFFISKFNESHLPFFQGYFGSFVYKLYYGGVVGNINAEVFNSFSGEFDSNSTFPLISYFSISLILGVATLIYFLALNILFIKMLSFIMSRERTFFLAFLASYTLVLGGWFWPYMNFFQALILYLFILLVFNGFRKSVINI
jgi:hypothetical protein